jgi:hypothetical protein
VLSTPPAFVLSQDQTLQTKPKKAIQKNLIQARHQKLASKKHHTPKREKKGMAKNNNKQKPPNTLLSSQTTHPR